MGWKTRVRLVNGLFGNLQNLPLVEQLSVLTQSVLVRLVNVEGVVVNGGGVDAFAQLVGGNRPERIARLNRVRVGARLGAGRRKEGATVLQVACRLRRLGSQGNIGNLSRKGQRSGGGFRGDAVRGGTGGLRI